MKLDGANAAAEMSGLDRLPGVSNYFTGHTASDWHTNAPGFARVEYRAVYPGVDLVYYGNQQQFEYDFRVAPHASPAQIKLAVEATGVTLTRLTSAVRAATQCRASRSTLRAMLTSSVKPVQRTSP
jgi:hypothetical protein